MYVFGAQLAAIVLGFVLNAAAAQTLAPAQFAALSWSLTWLAWLALCAQLGMMQAGTVLMAAGGRDALSRTFRPIVVAVAVNAVVVAVVWGLGLGPLIASASEDESVYRSMIVVIALWTPVAAMAPVMGGVLRGMHRFREAALYGEYVRRVLLLVALLIVVVADVDRRVSLVVAIAVAAETALGVAVVVGIGRRARSPAADIGPESAAALRRRGLAFLLPTIDAPLLPQAGVWLLALVRPAEEVAVLSVGIGISFVFGLPVFVGARVLGPRYTRAHTSSESLMSLEPLARRHATWSTAFVLAATAGLALVGAPLVELVFGTTYGDAATVAVIIGIGGIVNAATGSCAAALMHCGHERIVGVTALLAAASFLVLGLVLGDRWGADGVAVAAALVISSRNIHLAVTAHRRLGIRTWAGSTGTVSGPS